MSELAVEQQAAPSQGGFRGLFRRVKEGVKVFLPVDNKVPLESINDKTAAWAIDKFLGNLLQKKVMGNKWANEFSVPTVLAGAGYVSAIEKDYMKAFPQEFPRWRQAVQKLVNGGILQAIPLQQPDYNGETMHYKVVNTELLKEFAQQGEALHKK